MKKLLAIALVLMLALSLAACSDTGEMSEETQEFLGDNEVIGSVNGVDLYRYQYDHYLSRILSDYYTNYYETLLAYQGIDMLDGDSEATQQFLADMELYAWENVVQNEVLQQMAVEDYGITLDPTYLSNLLTQGFNFDFMINRYIVDLYPLMEAEALAAKVVSEADIQATYDADPTYWDSRRVAHIIIQVDPAADQATKDAAYAQTADLIAQLDAGADFATLAQENSQDGAAATGGEMELYFNANGDGISEVSAFDPLFAAAAFELAEVGDYSAAPVETSFGYHIIKLSDAKEGYEAAKEYIQAGLQQLTDEELTMYFQTQIEEKMEAAEIVRDLEFEYYVETAEEEAATDDAATDEAATDEAATDEAATDEAATDETATDETATDEDETE